MQLCTRKHLNALHHTQARRRRRAKRLHIGALQSADASVM
jgi:hypothetical protein